jgi:hypothetical protein
MIDDNDDSEDKLFIPAVYINSYVNRAVSDFLREAEYSIR